MAQTFLAEFLIFPSFQCIQHLGSKGFMNLVEIEILQGNAGTIQHARYCVCRGNQQTFFLAYEIHRCSFTVCDIRQYR